MLHTDLPLLDLRRDVAEQLFHRSEVALQLAKPEHRRRKSFPDLCRLVLRDPSIVLDLFDLRIQLVLLFAEMVEPGLSII